MSSTRHRYKERQGVLGPTHQMYYESQIHKIFKLKLTPSFNRWGGQEKFKMEPNTLRAPITSCICYLDSVTLWRKKIHASTIWLVFTAEVYTKNREDQIFSLEDNGSHLNPMGTCQKDTQASINIFHGPNLGQFDCPIIIATNYNPLSKTGNQSYTDINIESLMRNKIFT